MQNGKQSQLLATFDIQGKPHKKVLYKNNNIYNQRDVSTSQNFNQVMLEVKDERGELFDFRGQKLSFVLLIN